MKSCSKFDEHIHNAQCRMCKSYLEYTLQEDKGDDLRLSLKLLHLTNYSQRIAAEQGRYYL